MERKAHIEWESKMELTPITIGQTTLQSDKLITQSSNKALHP
jgi:hypothetical protein